MQRRHLPPGQLSPEILRHCLPIAPYQASTLYQRLTLSRRASAPPVATLINDAALRRLLPDDMGHCAEAVGALLVVLGDHQEARRTLFAELHTTRLQLNALERAARVPGFSQRATDEQNARDAIRARMLALSDVVYSYPFAGLDSFDGLDSLPTARS